jgi:hypothetical protein
MAVVLHVLGDGLYKELMQKYDCVDKTTNSEFNSVVEEKELIASGKSNNKLQATKKKKNSPSSLNNWVSIESKFQWKTK